MDIVKRLLPAMIGNPFTLFDIGCSGGISEAWRSFEPYLKVFAFDPNLNECHRLRSIEQNPEVKYISAFVSGSKDKCDFDTHGRNPWDRFAVKETISIRDRKNSTRSEVELTTENLWTRTNLADRNALIYLPDFMEENQIGNIDFIKIDVDGPDFEILKSLANQIQASGVLGIGMEVNWFGSDNDTDHTFHNTDRFLRSIGFDLIDVTIRRYALAALPSRYTLPVPAQSMFGRPYQGDALYIRDPLASHNSSSNLTNIAKLNKLVGIYASFGIYDHAAELIKKFPHAFECNASEILDILASKLSGATSYIEHMKLFREDDPLMYPPI